MAPQLQKGLVNEKKPETGRYVMKVKFVLTMDDLTVDDKNIDQVVFDWETDIDQEEILELSHKWITSKNFLTNRMEGLTRVGESSLTIEPIEEDENFEW